FNVACRLQNPVAPHFPRRLAAAQCLPNQRKGTSPRGAARAEPATQSWPCERRQQKYLQTNFLIAENGFPERPCGAGVAPSAPIVRSFALGGDFSAITMAQKVL